MADNPKLAAPPDEFPRSGGSASGTETAYTVEARHAYYQPEVIAGHLLDLRWSRIECAPAHGGVPIKEGLFPFHSTLGLLSYQAAQALRWWFIAAAAKDYKHLCIETRLVEHKITYSYSEVAERACAGVGTKDDRSHCFPPKSQASGEHRG